MPSFLVVERITRQEIESSEAGSAAELIGQLPALQVLTGVRGEALLQLRGFDQREILVLIDGVPSAVPFDGIIDLGKFPLAMIERIEIIKGAGPVIYGPGGLGGAINIITRQPEETPLFSSSAQGSPPYAVRASLVGGPSIGPFTTALFGGFEQRWRWPLSDSFVATANQPRGGRIGSGRTSGFGGGRISVPIGATQHLSLAGDIVGGNYDIPPSTTSSRPRYWRFDPWIAATASLTHSGRSAAERFETSEALFVSPFTNTLRSFDDAGYDTQNGRSTFTSTYDDLSAGGIWKARAALLPALDLRLWFGGRYERHHESQTGAATTYSHWLITAAPQLEWRIVKQAALLAAVQIDGEVPDRFAGVIEPRNQITAGPMLQLALNPHERVRIELSVTRRARFPTLKERFADAFGQRLPNPGLGAEKAWHSALDCSVAFPHGWHLDLSGFDSEVSGLIVREAVGGGQEQLQNAGRARLAGMEARLGWQWTPGYLDLMGGYQYLFAKRLDATFPSSQLEYRPEHKAMIRLAWKPWDILRFTTDAEIVGPRPYLNIDSGTWGRLPTKAVWNMRLEGEPIPHLRLWIAATNLLDANNTSEYGFPEPGRMIWAGLSFDVPNRANVRGGAQSR